MQQLREEAEEEEEAPVQSTDARLREIERVREMEQEAIKVAERQQAEEEERMQMSSGEEDGEVESIEEGERLEKESAASLEAKLMEQMFGCSTFGSSKNKPHTDTAGAVAKKTSRKYRQYMNRKGGFNRPLSPIF